MINIFLYISIQDEVKILVYDHREKHY